MNDEIEWTDAMIALLIEDIEIFDKLWETHQDAFYTGGSDEPRGRAAANDWWHRVEHALDDR